MNQRKLLAKILLENQELKKRKISWEGMEKAPVLRADESSGTKIKITKIKQTLLEAS